MALKKLLVALTTVRDGKRIRFAAGKTVDLTKGELTTLDALTVSTGVPHFRAPVNEVADEGEVVKTRAYIGEDTPVAKKNGAQLKAMLDHFEVEYSDKVTVKELKVLADGVDTSGSDDGETEEEDDGENGNEGEGEGEGDDNDPDAGL